MWVAVLKLQVEEASYASVESWQRDAKSLCEKLQARFKVVAKPCAASHGEYAVALVSLGRDETALQEMFEKVMAFCENTGIGRVSEEISFIEPLDVFADDEDEAH